MARIIIVWGLWGPYHCARFEAFRDHAARQGHQVTGVSLFSGSSVNQWSSTNLPSGVELYDLGKDETKIPPAKIGRLLAIPAGLKPQVALLPSYFSWSLMLNAAARLSGCRVVMMNDTHGSTTRTTGLKFAVKRRVVAAFHSGFVAGQPHKRYFASLGLAEKKIFTGYDAVDNGYFAQKAAAVKSEAETWRAKYDLPAHYFLSLGRFVEKKNLATLIRAYRQILTSDPNCQTHLVMVGSGEEEPRLRALCAELRLPVHQKATAGGLNQAANGKSEPPGVHFYGYRQIEENPVFYALADAFILPSLWEEWGLVVNEAMACGLPVIVSETAGCAEDLLEDGSPDGLETSTLEPPLRMARGLRQNGFVFDPKSPEALAAALVDLATHERLREVMGRSSRRIVEKFSCEQFARNALYAARVAMGEDPAHLEDAPAPREPARSIPD